MKYYRRLQLILLILLFSFSSKEILPQAGELDATFGQNGIVNTAINSTNFSSQAYSTALQSDGKVVLAGSFYNGSVNGIVTIRYNTDGSLDNTFGTVGIARIQGLFLSNNDRSMAIQGDGKIVVGGYADNGSDSDFKMVRLNTNGTLDNSFGTGGVVTTSIGTSSDVIHSITIQNDGKIVAAGYTIDINSDFAIARYNTDGTLDDTFGTNGVVTTNILASVEANSVAIQNDGKIVVTGYSETGNNYDIAIVRYNPNGVLDNTFGAGGIITTPITSTIMDVGKSTVIQGDGKIVTIGSFYNGNDDDIAIVRYNPNGVLDNTFGEDGIVFTGIDVSFDQANSMALQSDGKLVVAGYSADVGDADFAIVRYNTDGTLDDTFGTNGIVTTSLSTHGDFARSVVIQSDGKIVVAGVSAFVFFSEIEIARFNADGSLDNTFGNFGIETTPIGTSLSTARSVAIQDDGKIVAAGNSHNNINYDISIVRYNPDGSYDIAFGQNGIVTTQVGSSDDIAYSVAVQSDGKIIVGGASYENATGYNFAIVRYNTSGFLDNTFGGNGMVITSIDNSGDYISSIVVQSDGKIVAAGDTRDGSDDDIAVVRYNTDGSLDNSFGTNGIVTTEIGISDDNAQSIALQGDGKIVVAGYSNNGSDHDFVVVRYNTDGSLDNTFGTGGIVTTPVGTSGDVANSIIIQDDGKIIAAGAAGGDFAIVRYNTDGSLDNTFGTGGIVTTPIGSAGDNANSVTIQEDGKIVAVGSSRLNAGNGNSDDIAIVRYNPDGSLDNTFGTDGITTTGVGALLDDEALSVAIQSDGKIVAAGSSTDGNGYYVFTVVRYTADPPTGISGERSGEIPTDFALLQNYPNPFNPTTKIKIVIPKSSFVNLKVYDVLGKEIATLVNEEMQTGIYKVNFDAADLSSGIYFYRLQATPNGGQTGEFVQTKKMILLR